MDCGLGQTRSEILPQVSWESGERLGRDSALVVGPLKTRRSDELVHEQQATRSQCCSDAVQHMFQRFDVVEGLKEVDEVECSAWGCEAIEVGRLIPNRWRERH